MFAVTFDGGPADTRRRLIGGEVPERIVEDGQTYELARDEQGEAIHTRWSGYRFRWCWPETVPGLDAAPAHSTAGIPDRRSGAPG